MAQPTVNPPLDIAALKREARRKGTSPERLLELAEMEPELAREVARSPNTSPEVLAQLTELYFQDTSILELLARNPHTPLGTLEQLVNKVPNWVAFNKAAPESLLRRMAVHSDPEVRQAVLFNKSAPLDVAQTLLLDSELQSDPLVIGQMGVLMAYGIGRQVNKNMLFRAMTLTDFIPVEAALALAQHLNPDIRQALLQHSEKIAASVRPQIVSQLQGKTP